MVNDIENYSSYIQSSLKSVDKESLNNINELRIFRNEINQNLDKRETVEEIDKKKNKSETLLNELKVNCQDIKSATEKLKADLQAQEVNNNQLFVSGTRAIKEFVSLQSSLKDIKGRGKVPHSKFSRDPATEQLLSSNTAIDRMDQVASNLADELASDLADQQKQPQGPALNQSRADLSQSQFSKLPDVPVKALNDTRDCYLTSMALLPGDRLLLTDCANYLLKLLDTYNNKLVSQVKLLGEPWDLCLLPGERAAVTLPQERKIQFVSTQENVTLQDVVK
ncbi:uncharacterized protein LOC128218226 [Mya arenaria]|uniref:uncharacterized protein LOC128218226 n=1 Tax=Mya arenaria TaxID=6604 RepID=UPI0022E96F3F|nr:uncharacterized protein LOC128218226 [Mya arenaria]